MLHWRVESAVNKAETFSCFAIKEAFAEISTFSKDRNSLEEIIAFSLCALANICRKKAKPGKV